jgi:hypothetical protein
MSDPWTRVALGLGVAGVTAALTSLIYGVTRQRLIRKSEKRESEARLKSAPLGIDVSTRPKTSSTDDWSWQVTALALFGVTVVLTALALLGSTRTSTAVHLSGTEVFTDLAGAGALLSGVAAMLVFVAGYWDRRKRSTQEGGAQVLDHAIQHINHSLEAEDLHALADLARALNGDQERARRLPGSKKRREDRWERNVLELGELLTTSLTRLANEAYVAQLVFHEVRDKQGDEYDPALVARQARAAEQAGWDYGALISTQVDWLIDRIASPGPKTREIAQFQRVAQNYRARSILVRPPPDHDNRTDTEFAETWEEERSARQALISQVKLLADLPHPPRASRRARLNQRADPDPGRPAD